MSYDKYGDLTRAQREWLMDYMTMAEENSKEIRKLKDYLRWEDERNEKLGWKEADEKKKEEKDWEEQEKEAEVREEKVKTIKKFDYRDYEPPIYDYDDFMDDDQSCPAPPPVKPVEKPKPGPEFSKPLKIKRPKCDP